MNRVSDLKTNEVSALEQTFTRKVIDKYPEQLLLTDRDTEHNLDLFCYSNCTKADPLDVQNCRGVVFNGDEIVLKAFSYTPEFNHEEVDEIKSYLSTLSNPRFYESHEGTLIRVFFFKKWFVSTHRKLDAFKSKWSSHESFGTIFERSLQFEVFSNKELSDKLKNPKDSEVLTSFLNSLDKNNQYMFHIRNTKDNRIVCFDPKYPYMLHVGTFVNGQLNYDIDVGVTKPKELGKFESVNELTSFVSKLNPFEHQGVIIFADGNKQMKILNKRYQELFHIRGNEPSVKFRYLQLRMNKEDRDTLFFLYPERVKEFMEYEDILYKIAQHIHKSYIDRYINKQHVTLPIDEFMVMSACHAWHCTDRLKNRINEKKVIEMLNKQTPSSLNHMIRRWKLEKVKNTTHQTPRTVAMNNNKTQTTNQ